MKCKKCENIHIDPNTGMMICLKCGTVHEESQIVEALEFDENQNAAGTFMDANKPTYYFPGGRNILGQMMDPSQRNLNRAYKKIERTAKILTIPDNVVKTAKKLYNIASNKKFTKGRKTDVIVGAILYLACRFNKTKYLLIDFSEVLSINLFVIGSLYIKLVKVLGLTIDIIDPSLYMHRFCNKFNFGNKAKEVERTALKILQFMERDWITTGRRPSGLCGACILIAAKLHKLNVDINNISKVVHVCNQTILNRIDEFSLTRVASMTMEEFEAFKESHFYPGADPPAILKALKEKKPTEEIKIEENGIEENNEKKIENGQTDNGNVNNDVSFSFGKANSELNNLNNNLSIRDINSGLNNRNNNSDNDNFILRQINSGLSKKNISFNNESINLRAGNSGFSKKNFSFNNESLNLRAGNSGISVNNEILTFKPNNSGISKNSDNSNANLSLRPGNSGISRSSRIRELRATSTADEKLSNIPDNEEYKYIYNNDEYAVRKQFWEIMFKDWIEQQKEKEEKEGKEKKPKVRETKKRIKKMIFKSDGNKITPDEAIKSNNKMFGKKMNYSYIRSMLSKRE